MLDSHNDKTTSQRWSTFQKDFHDDVGHDEHFHLREETFPDMNGQCPLDTLEMK